MKGRFEKRDVMSGVDFHASLQPGCLSPFWCLFSNKGLWHAPLFQQPILPFPSLQSRCSALAAWRLNFGALQTLMQGVYTQSLTKVGRWESWNLPRKTRCSRKFWNYFLKTSLQKFVIVNFALVFLLSVNLSFRHRISTFDFQ